MRGRTENASRARRGSIQSITATIADQDDAVAHEGDETLREELVDDRHVVDDARHGYADDLVVVVAQVQPLQMVEQAAAQTPSTSLADDREQLLLARRP